MTKKEMLTRKKEMTRLIKKHGSPYKVAQALGLSPAAIYERMDKLGMPRETRRVNCNKPTLLKLLKVHKTVKAVAKQLACSVCTVHSLIERYNIALKHGAEPAGLLTQVDRANWLEKLLKKHGNASKVAKVLGCSKQAVYERKQRYGL